MSHSIINHYANTRPAGTGFLSSLVNALRDYGEAKSRRDQIEALDRLSDLELAKRGLTREGIARHVFRDLI